jgi:hypothetical protein
MLHGTVLRLPHGLTGDLVEYRIPPMIADAKPEAFAALDAPALWKLARTQAEEPGAWAWLATLVDTLAARSGWLASVESQFASIWRESSRFRHTLARPLPTQWTVDTLHAAHGALLGHGISRLRATPVWLGQRGIHRSAFVPPPPNEVPQLMQDLCAWLNRKDIAPHVLAAMAFLQLGAIHPYADGNGRLARWLWLVLSRRSGTGSSMLSLLLLAVSNCHTHVHEAAHRYVGGSLAAYAGLLERCATYLPLRALDASARLRETHLVLREALMRSGARPDSAARCAHWLMQRPVFTNAEFQSAMSYMASRTRAHAIHTLLQDGVLAVDAAAAPDTATYIVAPVKHAWTAVAHELRDC